MRNHFATAFFYASYTAYRTFRVVFIVDEPRVYRAPSAF